MDQLPNNERATNAGLSTSLGAAGTPGSEGTLVGLVVTLRGKAGTLSGHFAWVLMENDCS